jgi:branched-chain amino acid transport system substrate-binding protein
MVNDGNESGRDQTNGNGDSSFRNGRNGTDRHGRRTFLRFAGVGGGATVLAGCISGEGTPTSTPTDEPADGGMGTGTGTEVYSADGPIQIGALAAKDSPYGASILRGAKVAAKEINANGGIAGADVEVITKDTKDDPAVARKAYQELTTGQNVDYTVGIFGSEQLLSILPNVAQQGKLHLSTGAATPEASRKVSNNYEQFKYYFRAGPTNSRFLAQAMLDFANARFDSMGWDKIGLLIEDFKWTSPVRDALNSQMSKFDVDVSLQKVVPEGTKDFTPIYDEMESAGVDGCYTVLAHIGTPSLVQWAKQQRPFGYGGIHVGAQLPSFYKLTKGAARFTFTQTTATPTAEVTSRTVPFANLYKNEFDKFPVYDGYITYDAVYMIKRAIEAARSTASEDLIPVLEDVNRGGIEFTGAAGIPSFYGKDHRFTHDLRYNDDTDGLFFQWQEVDGSGSQQVIFPDDLATSSYTPPPWV